MRRAHSREGPYLRVFEELLERGADASILSYEGWEDVRTGRLGMPQSVFDVATDAGLGWKPGRLRRLLRALVDKHATVPKKRVFRCGRAAGCSACMASSHARADALSLAR